MLRRSAYEYHPRAANDINESEKSRKSEISGGNYKSQKIQLKSQSIQEISKSSPKNVMILANPEQK